MRKVTLAFVLHVLAVGHLVVVENPPTVSHLPAVGALGGVWTPTLFHHSFLFIAPYTTTITAYYR